MYESKNNTRVSFIQLHWYKIVNILLNYFLIRNLLIIFTYVWSGTSYKDKSLTWSTTNNYVVLNSEPNLFYKIWTFWVEIVSSAI